MKKKHQINFQMMKVDSYSLCQKFGSRNPIGGPT